MKQRTTVLKTRGYFGGKDRTVEHVIPEPIETDIDAAYEPMLESLRVKGRTLKSYLVQALADVRDGTGIYAGAIHGECYYASLWAEWHGLLKPLYALLPDYSRFIIYKVTPKGHAFLVQHEAPVYW